MSLLKDHQFAELCQILKVTGMHPNDPDKKVVEKAFRRLALKTHPDKGGDPIEFKKINEAYNRLIGHISRLEAIDDEVELSRTSVIIEISKQAVPKWKEKLQNAYGMPKTSKVNNLMFNGPYNQYRGKGKLTGPIILVLYEDPEDKVPKIVCRCDNYMAWMQEQKMPLHLHVGREKKIMFDQWRIMSLAEFGFVSLAPGHYSARHDYKDANANYKTEAQKQREAKEQAEKVAKQEAAKREAAERKRQEEEEAATAAKKAEEEKKKAEAENQPWWQKYADKYQGPGTFRMGETTPPPEDGFPKVFSMTSASFKTAGLHSKFERPADQSESESQPEKTVNKTEVKIEAPNVEEEKKEPFQMPEKERSKSTPKVVEELSAPKAEEEILAPKVEAEILAPKVEEEILAPKVEKAPSKSPREDSNLITDQGKEDIASEAKESSKKPDPVKEESSNKSEVEKDGDESKPKRGLAGLAEKMLSKSKVKKVKTKKATIKKTTKVVDEVQLDEKENLLSDDAKASTCRRKRPLEDTEPEDKQIPDVAVEEEVIDLGNEAELMKTLNTVKAIKETLRMQQKEEVAKLGEEEAVKEDTKVDYGDKETEEGEAKFLKGENEQEEIISSASEVTTTTTTPKEEDIPAIIAEEVVLTATGEEIADKTAPTTAVNVGQDAASGQVSSCQETNNYSLSTSTSKFPSRNASEEDLGKLDQQDLECNNDLETVADNEEEADTFDPHNAGQANEQISQTAVNHAEHAPLDDVVRGNDMQDADRPNSPIVAKVSRDRQKSASLEKAEQWLRERLQQKELAAKTASSSKESTVGVEDKVNSIIKETSPANSTIVPAKDHEPALPDLQPINASHINEVVTASPPSFQRALSPAASNIPSRFRSLVAGSGGPKAAANAVKEASVPRRGSVFDHGRRSSTLASPMESRATSPAVSSSSRQPSPHSFRSRSIQHLNINEQPATITNEDWRKRSYTSDRSKSMHREFDPTRSTLRGSSREDVRASTIRELGPVILIRPSTFIQAMSTNEKEEPLRPTSRPPAASSSSSSASSESFMKPDRIPSRFRRAMNVGASGMSRSKSIHELNEPSFSKVNSNLQDQIRQARADHRQVFNEAQSHTAYSRKASFDAFRTIREGSVGSARSRLESTGDWLNRTSSMRNVRASPTSDLYRRL